MLRLRDEIEFKPEDFKLPDHISISEDNLGSDRIVSTKTFFKPAGAKTPLSSPDKRTCKSVIVSNLPKDITEDEVLEMLTIRGNDSVKVNDVKALSRTERNSRFQIGPFSNYEILKTIIETIDFNTTKEKLFNDQKIFVNLHQSNENTKVDQERMNPDNGADDEERQGFGEEEEQGGADQRIFVNLHQSNENTKVDQQRMNPDSGADEEECQGFGVEGEQGGAADGVKPADTTPRTKQDIDKLYKYNKKECMNAEQEKGWFIPKGESKKFSKSTNFFTHEEIKTNKDLKKIADELKACRGRYKEDDQSPGKDYKDAPRNPRKKPLMST